MPETGAELLITKDQQWHTRMETEKQIKNLLSSLDK